MSTVLKITFSVLVGAILLTLLGHAFIKFNASSHIMQVASKYHLIFLIWRYALYALAIALWPYFIVTIGKSQGWPKEVITYFRKQRIKLLFFFIFIELFFVYNLLGHLLMWL